MADTLHSALTGAELHEPKGVAAATDGEIATASGGGILWTADITADSFSLNDGDTQIVLPNYIVFSESDGPDESEVLSALNLKAFNPVSDASCYCVFTLPHGLDATVDVIPKLNWAPLSAGSGNVVWDIDTYYGDTLAFDSSETDVDAAGGANVISTAVGTALVGTPTAGKTVVVKITRDTASASNTYGDNAVFLGCYLQLGIKALGS